MRYERRDVLHFRSGPSLVAGAVTLAVLVFFVADAAARGAWGLLAQAGPWFSLVAWAAIAGLIYPRLDVRADAARVVNPLRTWELPLTAISDLQMRIGLVLITTDYRRIRIWGADVSRRSAQSGSGQAGELRAALTEDVKPLPSGKGPAPECHWNVPLIAVGAVIALACVGTFLW